MHFLFPKIIFFLVVLAVKKTVKNQLLEKKTFSGPRICSKPKASRVLNPALPLFFRVRVGYGLDLGLGQGWRCNETTVAQAGSLCSFNVF